MSEGPSNALRFRSMVEVDGVTYTSPNTFLPQKKKKKNTEQDVAKVVLEHISNCIRDKGYPLVHEIHYIMTKNL